MATSRKTAGKAAASPKAKKAPPTKQAQGGGKVPRGSHSSEKVGSIPTPATKPQKKAAPKAPAAPLTPMQTWRARPEDEALSELCAVVIEGGHLAAFCKSKGIAYVTMLDWINGSPRRTEMYARAREDRSDLLADEIVAISDDSKSDVYIDKDGNERVDTEVVQRAKLRVDARKWVAAKLKPRIYGDKLTLDGRVDHSKTTDEELLATLAKYGIAAKIGQSQESASDA